MAKGRPRNFLSEPIYGTGLRILVVNDHTQSWIGLFRHTINDAEITGCYNASQALGQITASVRRKKPFNAILIDKNLGDMEGETTQKLIDKIGAISPVSHICIHSAETGPGKFARFDFISLYDRTWMAQMRRYIARIEKQPFRKSAAKIDLGALARPVPVRAPHGGVIKVFYVIEGNPLPAQMKELIAGGGQPLSIPEAIQDVGNVSRIADREALFKEAQRVGAIGLPARKPKAAQRKPRRRL